MELRKLEIANFKGVKKFAVEFGKTTTISGKNAAGKTTISDAFSWLLFNVDSHGNTKFEIRPLDSNGEKIHNTDIVVSAVIEIDGKQTELKKTQSEKWTKKRGHEERVFEGNVNSYEIDGYPKSEKEYAEFISSIVDADVFKILTNPMYFTAMPWKDQREILMRFVADMSDVELAQADDTFTPLIDELDKAPSTDDIQKKYAKQIKELKAKQTEIPTRIDEISKQKIAIDTAELELFKAEYERQLADLEKKSPNTELEDLNDELVTAEKAVLEKKADIRRSFNDVKSTIEAQLVNLDADMAKVVDTIQHAERDISSNEANIKLMTERKDALAVEYREVQSTQFSGSIDFDETKWEKPSTICSLCGQELPKDKADKIIAAYEDRKAAAKRKAEAEYEKAEDDFTKNKAIRVEDITKEGMKLKDAIAVSEKAIADAKAKLPELNELLEELNKRYADAKSVFNDMGDEPDYNADSDYLTLIAKENELRDKLSANAPKDENDIEKQRTEISVQLDDVKAKLAQAQNNIAIDERISELETEQRDTEQKIADAEKILYLLEKFIRLKLNRISEAVNSHFEIVRFRLFETQINGGIKETCEAEVNGVPFNSLNSGHRIIAGLDIIKALSTLYDVEVPIFLDNAESLSEGNMPTMAQQLILLTVSNDNDLVVEV